MNIHLANKNGLFTTQYSNLKKTDIILNNVLLYPMFERSLKCAKVSISPILKPAYRDGAPATMTKISEITTIAEADSFHAAYCMGWINGFSVDKFQDLVITINQADGDPNALLIISLDIHCDIVRSVTLATNWIELDAFSRGFNRLPWTGLSIQLSAGMFLSFYDPKLKTTELYIQIPKNNPTYTMAESLISDFANNRTTLLNRLATNRWLCELKIDESTHNIAAGLDCDFDFLQNINGYNKNLIESAIDLLPEYAQLNLRENTPFLEHLNLYARSYEEILSTALNKAKVLDAKQ